MKALLKGKLSISFTSWSQDSTGGRVESKIPIIDDIPFVARESRDPSILELPGKSGGEKIYKVWFETADSQLLTNIDKVREYGYVKFQGGVDCLKIISLSQVNAQSNRLGWEMTCRSRA